jgi:hypothetical protein
MPFDGSSAQGTAHEFVTRFSAQFASNPDAFAAFAHDAYLLVRAAVDAGATTRSALAAALPKTRSSALVAPASGFDATREPTHATGVIQLKGEGFETVATQ